MRRALWAALCLLTTTLAIGSAAWPLERQLAGVKLGDKALNLLTRPGFGQPNLIGPIGTVGLPAPEQAGAGGRSGPVGPGTATPGAGGRGGGMRAGGARGGARRGGRAQLDSPSLATAALPHSAGPAPILTGGMRGGGMRGGGARGGGAARGGAARGGGAAGGGAGRGGGMRGGGGRGGGGGAATGARTGAGGGGAGMYWYYRRPMGAVMVLSLSPVGEVKTITLGGSLPYAAGRTSRSIGLASTYMDIIARYGYPDQTATAGSSIELTYVDHGVRFTLEGMRVNRIAIGAEIVGGVEAAPAAPEAAPPPAGLSTEELRGYL